MATIRKLKPILTCLCLFVVLLKIFAENENTPDFGYADHSLTLSGPDEEGMMTCAMPLAFQVDVTVQWYVDGKLLKKELLSQGNLHLYESIQDMADLLGNFPQMVQCVVNQGTINWIPVISNKVYLSPQ